MAYTTTIRVHGGTKTMLDLFGKKNDSYDDIIKRLMGGRKK